MRPYESGIRDRAQNAAAQGSDKGVGGVSGGVDVVETEDAKTQLLPGIVGGVGEMDKHVKWRPATVDRRVKHSGVTGHMTGWVWKDDKYSMAFVIFRAWAEGGFT